MKVSETYMPSDKQYNGQLIDEYFRLKRILQVAQEENASATIRMIQEEMKQLRLKLQPIELED